MAYFHFTNYVIRLFLSFWSNDTFFLGPEMIRLFLFLVNNDTFIFCLVKVIRLFQATTFEQG